MVDCIENGGPERWPGLISLPSIRYTRPLLQPPRPNGIPTGGNFLFEDSRVEWISFNGDNNKIAPAAQSTAGIYFCKPVKIGDGPW